jgi:NTE family protein
MRTTLVLSGGGATGLAHVGVIRVLDSLGIRPDLVVGSSMGAVVGAMYASGYGGRALDSLVSAIPLDQLFGARPELPPALAGWPHLVALRFGSGTIQPELPFVKERELNIMLSAWLLEGNLQAAGDFDSLPIPLRVVATDLEHHRPMVLSGGDLARAVRASIAIPLLFRPVRANGLWLADGSLTANLPVSVARELDAERIIVSDATNHLPDSLDLEQWGNMGTVMLSMLLSQELDPLGPDDILVRSEVSGFAKFDFSPAARSILIAKGHAAAVKALTEDPCLGGDRAVDSRNNRRVSRTVLIDPRQSEGGLDLQQATGSGEGDPIDPQSLRSTLLQMGANDSRYDEVWLNPEVHGSAVRLAVTTRPSDPWVTALGVAYDGDLGIRGWVGVVRRRLFALDGSAHLRVAAGRWRQDAEAGMRFNPIARGSFTSVLSVGATHEDVRQFSADGVVLLPAATGELWSFLGIEHPLGRGWSTRLGATYAGWRDSTHQTFTAPGIGAQVIRRSETQGVAGRLDAAWNAEFTRVAFAVEWRWSLGRLRITPAARFGWGRHLPLQYQFVLGGAEGFPGQQIGEGRNAHETVVRVGAIYRLLGPVSVTAEGATGLTSATGDVLPDGDWRVGIRAGVSVSVPFGPLRVEYGRSTGGRSAVLLRIGRWF